MQQQSITSVEIPLSHAAEDIELEVRRSHAHSIPGRGRCAAVWRRKICPTARCNVVLMQIVICTNVHSLSARTSESFPPHSLQNHQNPLQQLHMHQSCECDHAPRRAKSNQTRSAHEQAGIAEENGDRSEPAGRGVKKESAAPTVHGVHKEGRERPTATGQHTAAPKIYSLSLDAVIPFQRPEEGGMPLLTSDRSVHAASVQVALTAEIADIATATRTICDCNALFEKRAMA